MGYQAPAFMIASIPSGLALSAVSTRNSSTLTDASKRALIDLRAAPVGSFTATAANAGVQFDFGSTAFASLMNRAVIPGGHNFASETVQIISGTSAGIGTPTVLDSIAVSSLDGVLDFDWSPVAGHRYFGLQVTTSGSEVFTLGELWIGQRSVLSADAWVQPGWGDRYEQEVTEDRFGGRTATVQLSPARRRFALEVRNLDPAGSDFSILDSVIRNGRAAPFWYWPPDSEVGGPFLVQLVAGGSRFQESRAPLVQPRYAVTLEMVEQLT